MDEAYADQQRWTRMSIMSTAGSGYFSSDRTIQQYAEVHLSARTLRLLWVRSQHGTACFCHLLRFCRHEFCRIRSCHYFLGLQEIWGAKPCSVPANM